MNHRNVNFTKEKKDRTKVDEKLRKRIEKSFHKLILTLLYKTFNNEISIPRQT